MTPQIATSREQSERLLKCGVSMYTADFLYVICRDDRYALTYIERISVKQLAPGNVPAWSLSALLMLLPKRLDDFPFTKWYEPFGEGEIEERERPGKLNGEVKLYFSEDKWVVDYDWDGFLGTLPQSEHPIEAVIQAIELLHANGYKLNEP